MSHVLIEQITDRSQRHGLDFSGQVDSRHDGKLRDIL